MADKGGEWWEAVLECHTAGVIRMKSFYDYHQDNLLYLLHP
jgi:hypothetical protein